MKKHLDGYILSHTHWDREWYLPFQELRMRLVNLLDSLIPYQELHPEFTHFHLDGQTICLEDYLEIRPEQKERLLALIRAGRITPGPWYVLPDLLCIGQESVLRNLNLGVRLAGEAGSCSPTGYLPDIFSHTSQLPQIFADYGFLAAVVWRGASGTADDLKSEVEWEAPDGTRILTIHLPDDRGYLNAFPLEDTPEAVASQFDQWFEERAPYSTTGQILFMNGCDHQNPNYRLPEYISYYNKTHTDRQLHLVSLAEYLTLLIPRLQELKCITGELNCTNHTTGRHLNPTLKNTLSSRIPQKIRNYQCESLLVRYCEPLAAMAGCAGMDTFPHFLNTAWKYLLQNHPHDSICGCSCDQVHLDMEQRFSWSSQIAIQCRNEFMKSLGALKNTQAFTDGFLPVHVFRLLPFPSYAQAHRITLRLPAQTFLRDIEMITIDGQLLPCQILKIHKEGLVLRDFDKDPSWEDYLLVDVLVEIPFLPAMSFITLGFRPVDVPVTLPAYNAAASHTLENEFLKVDIAPNGTLCVTHKASGQIYPGLHLITDSPDIGDEYIYSPPSVNPVWNSYTQTPSLELIHGPLCSQAVLTWEYPAPGAAIPAQNPAADSLYPGQQTTFTGLREPNRIRTVITLKKSSPLLYFSTYIENHSACHRIQIQFPTGMNPHSSFADSHFDITEHSIHLEQPSREAWVETENGCFSQKRFVFLEEDKHRFVFLGKGLTEYNVIQTESGQALAVTLLRSVNRIGSHRSLTCYGSPGPKSVYTQDSMLLQPYCTEYSLLFQNNDEPLQPLAEEYHSPCCFWQDTLHNASQDTCNRFSDSIRSNLLPPQLISLEQPDFVLSALKPWEGGPDKAILVRGYSLSAISQQVTLTTGFCIKEAWYASMNETLLSPVTHSENQICFTANSRKIITIVLIFK